MGAKVIVVGERGHVLASMDGGQTWKQVQVPTRSTLTAVHFVDDQVGYTAGHDAVILKTEDGGQTWRRVHYAPEEERPLFDLWFSSRDQGVAIGAYGYYLETEDGGETWSDRVLRPVALASDAETSDPAEDALGEDLHLYGIAQAPSGKLYMAAEAGAVYRSDDGGGTWFSLPSPYEGSFFGVLPLPGDALLLFGLQGRLFRSEDAGVNWTRVDAGTEAILMGGVQLQDTTVVIVGFAGTVLTSSDGGQTFDAHLQEDRAALATIVESGARALILVGEHGVRRVDSLSGRKPEPAVHR